MMSHKNEMLLSRIVFTFLTCVIATQSGASPLNENPTLTIENTYSRGNDDAPEGLFETALMGVRLVVSAPLENGEYQASLKYSAAISTPEASHVKSAFNYFATEIVHSYQALDHEKVRTTRLRAPIPLGLEDKNFENELKKGRNLDTMGKFVSFVTPLTTIDTDGDYSGTWFLQSPVNGVFTTDQNGAFVKHKIWWTVQKRTIEGMPSFRANIRILQPKKEVNVSQFLRWIESRILRGDAVFSDINCPNEKRFRPRSRFLKLPKYAFSQ